MDDMNHATISKSGEVDFPLWVKVIAWLVGLVSAFAVPVAIWFGGTIIDMNLRMVKIESTLEQRALEAYPPADARSQDAILQLQIENLSRDIERIEERLGLPRRERSNGET